MKTKITPKIAKELLLKNTINRPVNESNLYFFVDEIKSGRFVYNGQTIVISDTDKLLDGQHRLLACIETGIDIEVEVIKGVPEDVFHSMDSGRPRKASDTFSSMGIKNHNVMSSSTRKIIEGLDLKKRSKNGAVIKISTKQLLDFYYKEELKINSLYKLIFPLYSSQKLLPPSFSIALAFLLNDKVGDHRGQEFIRQIFTGKKENPSSNAPIVVRDRLIKDLLSTKGKLTLSNKRNLILNCFDKYIKGQNIKMIPSSYYNDSKFGFRGESK